MRIFTTKTSKSARLLDRGLGFTLIELLIVVAILAVLASLITPGLGAERRVALHTESDRLTRAIELVRVNAVSSNRQWGLRPSARSYGFEYFDARANRWRKSETQPFAAYELPTGFELTASADSRALQFGRTPKAPAVLILSSGEMTPFSIELFSPHSQSTCQITSDGMARTEFSCT